MVDAVEVEGAVAEDARIVNVAIAHGNGLRLFDEGVGECGGVVEDRLAGAAVDECVAAGLG